MMYDASIIHIEYCFDNIVGKNPCRLNNSRAYKMIYLRFCTKRNGIKNALCYLDAPDFDGNAATKEKKMRTKKLFN